MLCRVDRQQGFILMITLVFIFVITLIVMTDSDDIILQHKMQSNMQNEMQVFARAEFGLQQMIFALQGESIQLPDSTISLITTKKVISVDDCGNKTIDITSVAANAVSTVTLNSRAIFAKVPREKYCRKLPAYRCLWWKKE